MNNPSKSPQRGDFPAGDKITCINGVYLTPKFEQLLITWQGGTANNFSNTVGDVIKLLLTNFDNIINEEFSQLDFIETLRQLSYIQTELQLFNIKKEVKNED